MPNIKNPASSKAFDKTNTTAISWTALEFEPRERQVIWFVGFFLVFGALIAYAIFSRSLITTIMFSVLAVVSFGFAIKKPRRLGHILSPAGIQVGNTFFSYKQIKKFWIDYNPPLTKTLNFETTAYLNNLITLQLENQDPIEVKSFLKKYLLEDLDREESLSEAIARKLKF